jgi:hypothetical protein
VAHKVFFLRRAENRLDELGVYITSEAGLAVADGYLGIVTKEELSPAIRGLYSPTRRAWKHGNQG